MLSDPDPCRSGPVSNPLSAGEPENGIVPAEAAVQKTACRLRGASDGDLQEISIEVSTDRGDVVEYGKRDQQSDDRELKSARKRIENLMKEIIHELYGR